MLHGDDQLLNETEVNKMRVGIGQLLWLTPIRPDIQYETKEIARTVTKATKRDERKLKHSFRYIKGTKDYEFEMKRRICGF